MNEKVWTKEQQEAIQGLGSNLLVSAAAGSGKTAVLIERIINLVTSGKASVNELLVVTFTDAAAAEMKTKLYKALDKAGLTEELELMPDACISNFHSFAYSIVRRYYHVIGLNPGLTACDNVKSGLLKEEALDDLFETKFMSKDKDFYMLLDTFETGPDSGALRGIILKLYNSLLSMPNPWEWTESVISNDGLIDMYMSFGAEEVIRLLLVAREYHVWHQKVLANAGLDKLANLVAGDIGYHDSAIAGIKADIEKGLASFASEKFSVAKLISKENKEILEDAKILRDYAKKCRDEAKDLATRLNKNTLKMEREALAPVLKALFSLTKEFDALYKEKKAKEKCIDFSDMEHYALDILEDESVCAEYRDKFKYIFIDEYQDTNSLQETLINKIKREDNLFMVGDVKQCIYKFRLAEPELFMGHYASFKENETLGKAIDLNANFRSKPYILSAVNDIFEKLMTKESCGMPYDEAAKLNPGLLYEEDLEYPVKFYTVDTSSDDEIEEIADLRKAELSAIHAASIIDKYIGKPIYDSELGKTRPLTYKDMVVLIPQQKNVGEVYYKSFVDNNIPVYLERDTGYFDTIEIGVFINLLQIIDNPKQDIALLSVLCCPIFGFTADELASARKALPEASFSESFFEYAKTNEKAKDFVSLINSFKEKSKVLPLADFIYDLLLSTGYMDFSAAQNAGAQKLANLKALVDRAESFEKTNMMGLSGFISFAEALAKHGGGVDLGQAKTISSTMNCVRIMTIHKSKGLEFPFVLVSDMDKSLKGKSDSASFMLHKKLGVAVRLKNAKAGTYVDTKIGELIRLMQEKENLAERIRLLYVAMTRAKDILVLSSVSKVDRASKRINLLPGDSINAKTYMDLLSSAMPASSFVVSDKGLLSCYIEETKKASEEFEKALSAPFDAEDDDLVAVINYPYQPEEVGAKRKYSVSQIAEAENKAVYLEKDFRIPMFIKAEDHGLAANERGTAYHAVMEHIPFKQGWDIESINSFIASLKEKNILSPAEASCVNPYKIKDFFESEIGKRAAKSSKLNKEAPFVLKTEYKGSSTLVQGTIDCFFEENGELVLVDYKSNYVDKENKPEAYKHLKDTYKPQLALYKEALEKITGKKVKEAYLYLFGTSESLKI